MKPMRLACPAVLRLLQAYHDGELQVVDQIAVAAHLDGCGGCHEALADLERLGELLRAEAPGRAPLACDEAAGFVSTVVNRARVEDSVSFVSWVHELFDDRRVVYSSLGAATATLACLVIMLTMLRFSAKERTDSLAAMLNELSGPAVPTQPVVIRPMVVDTRVRVLPAVDKYSGSADVSDLTDSVLALSGVVTSGGQVSNIEVNDGTNGIVMASMDSRRIESLVDAMSKTRFEPVKGDPVSVNWVWFVAHTTVRGTGRRHSAGPQYPTHRRNVI